MYSIPKSMMMQKKHLQNFRLLNHHLFFKGFLCCLLFCWCMGGCGSRDAASDVTSFAESQSYGAADDLHSEGSDPVPSDLAAASGSSDFSTLCLTLFTEWVQCDGLTLHYTLDQPEAYGISLSQFSLGSASSASMESASEELTSAKEQLGKIDFDSLTLKEQIDYRIIMDYLDRELAQTPFLLYEEPLNSSTGIQAQLPILLSEYAFSEVSDVTNYFSLLNSVDEYFASLLQFEQAKKEAGLFMQPESLDRIIDQCEAFTANTENNFLITTFDSRLASLPGVLMPWDKTKLQEENKRLVLDVVLPAYEMLLSGLRNLRTDLQTDQFAGTAASPDNFSHTSANTDTGTDSDTNTDTGTSENTSHSSPAGLCRLPKGQEWYEQLVREATGSSLDTESLFTRTQEEVNQAMSVLSALCREHPVLTEDITASAFSIQTPTDIVEDLKVQIGLYFPAISDSSCTIRYVEECLQDYVSPAFYLTSPIDTCRHTIYINENESFDPSQLYPTLAHEAFPGHLYQDTYFHDHNDCDFRTLLYYPGYTEGWAVYSELFSYTFEKSFSTELCTALQKSQEITLGLYALMDMGIHYYGWNEAQIAGMLKSYFGIEDEQTADQIFQLILEDPANYLSYYVGYQELSYVKTACETKQGESFDLLQFHEAVLTIGPGPYALVKEYVPVLMSESNQQ